MFYLAAKILFITNLVQYRKNFFYKNTRLIFAKNLRTIQPQQKNKVSNFQLKQWTK